ncbi:MAG: bifunctional diaminohydroxyphosphoribosylaminopyrimidine deaminase/5-amino-6-(5-phosphoribosylamino)uracil reductase RibD [Spongiibacteraceae bacterium]
MNDAVDRSAFDNQCMAEALQLARRGLYTTAPNPRVGCVLVCDRQVIGRGWHEWAGQPHAEIHALRDAAKNGGENAARGATAYVTLEPCAHHGRTPPCCEALVAAGVVRVVAAMRDPNPLVAGKGLDHLRAAGIAVDVGVMENEARELNRGFVSRMERGRPWVRVKLAMSLDGRTAMASGESQWLTGIAARSDVQRLRARSSAVISGVDTVLADNAALSVRASELGLDDADMIAMRQPLRVVLDSQLRLRPPARIFGEPGLLMIATLNDEQKKWEQIVDAGAQILHLPAASNRIDLHALLSWLTQQQCNEVLVEAGPTLAGAFLQAGLVDWVTIYMAPSLLGSNARPLFELPLEKMKEQMRLDIRDIRAVGNDWRIDAEPIYKIAK